MRGALLVGAAACVFAAYAASQADAPERDDIVVSSTPDRAGRAKHYWLHSSASEGACIISLSESLGARQAILPEAACGGVNANVSTARWWQERPDGSVALMQSNGHVVAEFAMADGAAFESYNPVSPILVLLSDR